MFTNGPGDWGLIPGQVIPKTQKNGTWLLPCLALSTIRSWSRVNWSNPGNGVVPFLTSLCSSYWKGSQWVTLDFYLLDSRNIVFIIGIILRWGFLIWELIFYLLRTFCPYLGSFFCFFLCVISSFTTFRPNFPSGLLQVIYHDLG